MNVKACTQLGTASQAITQFPPKPCVTCDLVGPIDIKRSKQHCSLKKTKYCHLRKTKYCHLIKIMRKTKYCNLETTKYWNLKKTKMVWWMTKPT